MADKDLTIFSFNFAGLPLITKNYRSRLSYLLDFLPKVEADVFCFQEVWSKRAQKKIIACLKNNNFFYHFRVSGFCFNGLLIVSRYPIKKGQFYPIKSYFYDFKRFIMELPLFSKGYQAVDLILPKTKIKLFNVHLRIDWSQELLRESKPKVINRQAVGNLINHINLLGEKKVVLAGDFNIRPQDKLYKQLVDLAKLQPVSPVKGKMVLSLIFRWSIASGVGISDHIFAKNFFDLDYQTQIVANKPIKNEAYLSDHAAILTKIFWRK
jgi:endonuclease/exonuclease/phosphatase family metal-dependent hydrolase